MNTGASLPDPLPAELHRIDGLRDFQERVRQALELVADRGDPQVLLCDADYADWPLGERRVVEALERWARSHRRLVVFGMTFDEVVRRHPRWVTWRRHWSHVVECRQPSDIEPAQCPTLLVVPSGPAVLRLHDRERFRGIWSTQPSDLVSTRELLEAVSQRSVETFGATTLGL